eukprot:3237121-Pyramimonas_sp.AAC.1
MIRIQAKRYFFWMGGWGAPTLKPTVLWATGDDAALRQLVKSKKDAQSRLGDRASPLAPVGRRFKSTGATGWSKKGWYNGR